MKPISPCKYRTGKNNEQEKKKNTASKSAAGTASAKTETALEPIKKFIQ
jgi:hypothetical protein